MANCRLNCLLKFPDLCSWSKYTNKDEYQSIWINLLDIRHFITDWQSQKVLLYSPQQAANRKTVWCSKQPTIMFFQNFFFVCTSFIPTLPIKMIVLKPIFTGLHASKLWDYGLILRQSDRFWYFLYVHRYRKYISDFYVKYAYL